MLVCSSLPGLAAEPSAAAPTAENVAQAEGAKQEEHRLPPDAPRLGSTGSSFVTSSMVVTWVVALGLILFARFATRRMQLTPAGAQNFLEWLVETLYDFLEGIIGSKLVKRTFWFFATVFIFILSTNWFGLIPGVGSVLLDSSCSGSIRRIRVITPVQVSGRPPSTSPGCLARWASRPTCSSRTRSGPASSPASRERTGTRPALLIHGHLDVVPANASDWRQHPFGGEIADGCVWGRGAVDMKDMDAIMLAVARQRIREGRKPARDVVLAFTADEEAGGNWGARFLIEQHAEYFEGVTEAIGEVGGFSVPVGEQRVYAVQTAEKGLAWMRLTANGTAGHGSMIHPDNAVTALAEALARVGRHQWPTQLPDATRAISQDGERGARHRVRRRRPGERHRQARRDEQDDRRHHAAHRQPDDAQRRLQGQRHTADRDRRARRAVPAGPGGGVLRRDRPAARLGGDPGVHPP